MLRVLDLDKSLDFYVNKMGMKLLRRQDYPGGEFTLAFVGYGDEKDQAVIELTGLERFLRTRECWRCRARLVRLAAGGAVAQSPEGRRRAAGLPLRPCIEA